MRKLLLLLLALGSVSFMACSPNHKDDISALEKKIDALNDKSVQPSAAPTSLCLVDTFEFYGKGTRVEMDEYALGSHNSDFKEACAKAGGFSYSSTSSYTREICELSFQEAGVVECDKKDRFSNKKTKTVALITAITPSSMVADSLNVYGGCYRSCDL